MQPSCQSYNRYHDNSLDFNHKHIPEKILVTKIAPILSFKEEKKIINQAF
jgi:hypothetical protein